MTLILDLPPDVEAQLAARATEQGVAPSAYGLQILRAALPKTDDLNGPAQSVETPENPTVAALAHR